MIQFVSALFFFVLLAAQAASHAGEPGPTVQQSDPLKLRPYIHCDGFAEGVRATILDRRPPTSKPWREVSVGGKSQRVSVVDGYRVMYSYPRTFPFARLKPERSNPSQYAEDKRIVTLNLVEMGEADGNLELVNFSDKGFSGQTLTKKELTGTTLGLTQIFSDQDSVIVTIFFLNQLPENRKFQTYEDFLSLRDNFVRGYIECVAKKKAAPTISK
jgi:hypothetical protein